MGTLFVKCRICMIFYILPKEWPYFKRRANFENSNISKRRVVVLKPLIKTSTSLTKQSVATFRTCEFVHTIALISLFFRHEILLYMILSFENYCKIDMLNSLVIHVVSLPMYA
jgi:hypothetical protein